jgi:hypothetical protein
MLTLVQHHRKEHIERLCIPICSTATIEMNDSMIKSPTGTGMMSSSDDGIQQYTLNMNQNKRTGTNVSKRSSNSRKVRFSERTMESSSNYDNDNTDIQIQIIPIQKVKSQYMKSKLWYSIRDIATILEQCSAIIKLMDMGYTDETMIQCKHIGPLLGKQRKIKCQQQYNDVVTTRGLERETKKGKVQFVQIHRSSISVVLQQQQYYDHHTTYQPIQYADYIASLYKLTTKESTNRSIQLGKMDEKFVQDYCRDCYIQSTTTGSTNVYPTSMKQRIPFRNARKDTKSSDNNNNKRRLTRGPLPFFFVRSKQ